LRDGATDRKFVLVICVTFQRLELGPGIWARHGAGAPGGGAAAGGITNAGWFAVLHLPEWLMGRGWSCSAGKQRVCVNCIRVAAFADAVKFACACLLLVMEEEAVEAWQLGVR
jgi:hypothetical protein